MRNPVRLASLTGAVALAIGAGAQANDNSIDPSIEVSALHNTNLRLGTGTEENAVSGGYIDAQAVFRSSSQTTNWTLTPRVRSNQYLDDPDEETNDWSVTGAVDHRGEKSRVGLRASYADQDVINTVLLPTDGGELGTPGSGGAELTQQTNKAEIISVVPEVAYRFSTRTSVEVNGDYTDVDYQNNVNGGQHDYTNTNGSVGLAYQASERIRVLFAGNIADFSPDEGAPGAQSYGFRIEAWREQTERLRGFLRLGTIHSDIEGASGAPNETFTNFIFGAGIERIYELSNLLLQANRSIDGNGSGDLQLRDELYLQYSRKMGPRTSLELGARAVWLETVDERSTYPDRDYYVGTARFDWRLRRTVSLFARYEYNSQKYSNSDDRPDSNAIYLGMLFEPHRRD